MTLSEAKKIYILAGGPADYEDFEWREIHKEIQAVVKAKSDRDAGKIILWWGCWNSRLSATSFARRIRMLYNINKNENLQ